MRAALLTVLLLSSTLLVGFAAARPTIDVAPAYRADGAHALNVSTASRFTLEDASGGALRYRFIGGAVGAAPERVYAGPFRIVDEPGFYTGPRIYQLQAWRDGESETTSLTFYVDDVPPRVSHEGFRFTATSVSVPISDDRVGVDRAVLWRSVDEGPYVPLTLTETQPGVWSTEMPREARGARVSAYIQAWDRLENNDLTGNATAPYFTADVANSEPTVRITAPNASARVTGRVLVAWEAADPDGDALTFAVLVRGPADGAFRELAQIRSPDARSYTLDTTGLTPGEHVVRVTASDGAFVALDETTIVVQPRAEVIRDVRLEGEAYVGATLVLRANVTRVGARVEARVMREGALAEAFAMADDGLAGDERENDGSYALRLRVAAEGPHTIDLFAQYAEDGLVKATTLEAAASFEGIRRAPPDPPSRGEYAPAPGTPGEGGEAPPPAIPWPGSLAVAALAGVALAARRRG